MNLSNVSGCCFDAASDTALPYSSHAASFQDGCLFLLRLKKIIGGSRGRLEVVNLDDTTDQRSYKGASENLKNIFRVPELPEAPPSFENFAKSREVAVTYFRHSPVAGKGWG